MPEQSEKEGQRYQYHHNERHVVADFKRNEFLRLVEEITLKNEIITQLPEKLKKIRKNRKTYSPRVSFRRNLKKWTKILNKDILIALSAM